MSYRTLKYSSFFRVLFNGVIVDDNIEVTFQTTSPWTEVVGTSTESLINGYAKTIERIFISFSHNLNILEARNIDFAGSNPDDATLTLMLNDPSDTSTSVIPYQTGWIFKNVAYQGSSNSQGVGSAGMQTFNFQARSIQAVTGSGV